MIHSIAMLEMAAGPDLIRLQPDNTYSWVYDAGHEAPKAI